MFLSTTNKSEISQSSIRQMPSLYIVTMSGLTDGLNPCALTVLVLYALYLSSFSNKGAHRRKIAILFIINYSLFFYFFLMGGLQWILLDKEILNLTGLIFQVIGVVFIVLGVLKFWQWYCERFRNTKFQMLDRWLGLDQPEKRDSRSYFFFTLILGLLCGFMASYWPPYSYILLITNTLLFPGQMKTSFLLLGLYTLMYMLPVIVVTVLYLVTKENKKIFGLFQIEQSMKHIIEASCLLGVGAGIIYLIGTI